MSRYIDADDFIKQQRELYCKYCTRRFRVKNGKMKEVYKIGEAQCKSCELNDSLDSLDDYPEADVAPIVYGYWITMPNYEYSVVPFKCSVCDYRFAYRSKFCPECGARMYKEDIDDV